MKFNYQYNVGEQVGIPEADNAQGLFASILENTTPVIRRRRGKWLLNKEYLVFSGSYEWGWVAEAVLYKVLQGAIDKGSVMPTYFGISRFELNLKKDEEL